LKPGDHLWLTVSDTGSGMPPDVQDHIFEPFYSTKKAGSGFGLSNVAGIIKDHEGDIRVSSAPGLGTTFEVFLPLRVECIAPAIPETAPSAYNGSERLVLVVDDEDNIRKLLSTVLNNANYRTVHAVNGADAIVKVGELKERLNYIITDMHMPQLDGLGLIRKVREILPALPIVVMTGRLEGFERERIEAQNVTAIVEKPFTAQAILRALR
jgi:CheY-like chemotaxis protein